jgi:hypothetical protein
VELDPLEGTTGSLDTAPITTTDRADQLNATEYMCHIILSSLSPEGQVLFCGHPALIYPRRTHLPKQLDGSKQAALGVYEGVLNASKKVVDGILSAYESFEEREERSKTDLLVMESSLYASAQKQKSEDEAHPKTPSSISFNLSDQPPLAGSARREQMRSWRDASDEAAPPSDYPSTFGVEGSGSQPGRHEHFTS